MSFKCNYCSKPQLNGVKPNRVVVETRNVTYRTNDGQTPTGTEIVKEVDLCATCVVEQDKYSYNESPGGGMADAPSLGGGIERCESSSLSWGTIFKEQI